MKDTAVTVASDQAVALPNLDTIIRGLLYVYIFCLPFNRLLFVERNGLLILIVLLALWCVVNQRHFFTRTPLDFPLIAFVGWVALTVPFAVDPLYSAKEFAKLLQQVLIFYVVVQFFKDGRHRARLTWMLVGVLAVVSAYGLFQFKDLLGALPQEGELMLVESVTPGEVWLTTYLVMLIPLGLAAALCDGRPFARRIGFGVTGLATLCLLLTYSRAGLLALLCEAVVIAWFVRRRAVLIAMVLSVVVMVLGSSMLFQARFTAAAGLKASSGSEMVLLGRSSLAHRFETWKFATAKLADHWLVGVGYGKDGLRLAYQGHAEKGLAPGNLGTHNTFLDVAISVGLPGLVLFVWLLWRIARKALAAFRSAGDPSAKAVSLGVGVGVAGLAVRLMFDHMFIGTLAIQFWVLVALAMVVYTEKPSREQTADASR